MTDLLADDRRDATFDADRTFRYRLRRTWDVDADTLCVVMVNPSTADEASDDRTIERCIGFARRWGYGTLLVGNLFAFQATDPDALRDRFREAGRAATVGPENDAHLRAVAREADNVLVAWGVHGSLGGRGREVARLLREDVGVELQALDTTRAGHPVHPLYQPADATAEPFAYAEASTDEQ